MGKTKQLIPDLNQDDCEWIVDILRDYRDGYDEEEDSDSKEMVERITKIIGKIVG